MGALIVHAAGRHGPRRRPALDDEPEEEYVVFEGYSVDDEGNQHYLDSHVAYRQAALDAIEYLKKFGYTGEQAYMILSTVPVEGRQSGVVHIPNACSTLAVPKEVFDFDISPSELGEVPNRGQVSITDDPLGD